MTKLTAKRSSALTAHYEKYRKLVPALALIFTIGARIENAVVPASINAAEMELAIHWAKWLGLHAERVYASVSRPDLKTAHVIGELIATGLCKDGTPVRELYRKGRADLVDRADADRGLAILEECHWIRVETIHPQPSGRPSDVVRLHPGLMQWVQKQSSWADKTDKMDDFT